MVAGLQICGLVYFPFLVYAIKTVEAGAIEKEELGGILQRVKILLVVAIANSKEKILAAFFCFKRIVGILYFHQGSYQLFWHVPDRMITGSQIRVHIVDNSMTDIRVLLQHIEEHCSTSHKGLNVCHIIPILKIYRQL